MPATETAVALAAEGFRVFHLRRSTDPRQAKLPGAAGYSDYASADPETVARRWETVAVEANPAIATGRGLLVLDIDTKHGKPGFYSLLTLEVEHGALPETRSATTASGGRHFYFKIPNDAGVSVGTNLAGLQGIDWRGDGGYAVAPGATLPDGRAYRWDDPATPLAEAPGWLVDLCRAKTPAPRNKPSTALVEPDQPVSIEQAKLYLRKEAPVAIAFGGGNATTYAVAAHVRDLGISEALCADLMGEHWNEAGGAEPPWEPGELADIVANAYRYAQNPMGSKSALADFGDVTEFLEQPKKPIEKPRSRLYRVPFDSAADMAIARMAPPLIKGVIDQQTLTVMYGASNTGKTFIMLDIAWHIATGRPWWGRRTTQGPVLYVAAEGGRGVMKRIAALRTGRADFLDLPKKVPLDIIPCPIDLLHGDADVKALAALANEVRPDYGAAPILLVIDTLSRALAGGDENASTDMGAFVRNVDRLRMMVRCAVAVVHHSGKDAAKGARGWSGLRAAIDTEIEIAENEIRVEKQRDLERDAPRRFRLRTVDIGTDEDGETVQSCVVEQATEFSDSDMPISAEETAALDALELGPETGMRHNDWQAAFWSLMPSHVDNKGAFTRARTAIARAGYVQQRGRLWVRTGKER